MNGVDSDFKEITAVIQARETPLTYEELYAKLIDHEMYLNQAYSYCSRFNAVTANYAKQSTNSQQPKGGNQRYNSTSTH